MELHFILVFLVAILVVCILILRKEVKTKMTIDDVNQEVTKIETDVTALTTAVSAAVAEIASLNSEITALQNGGGATPAQLAALTSRLTAIAGNLEGQTNALTAAEAPATPPTPTPTP
jgi:peptidoglycan hydrolase CwlO-like protein